MNLQIPLTPTAAIHGRVISADGQPPVKATVQALKPTYQSGPQSFSVVQSTVTNDLGEYRLYWLTPGKYYVGVSAPDWGLLGDGVTLSAPGPLPRITTTTGARFSSDAGALPLALGGSATIAGTNRYVPIYFPNTSSPEAALGLDLKPGDDLGGIEACTRVNGSGPADACSTNRWSGDKQRYPGERLRRDFVFGVLHISGRL